MKIIDKTWMLMVIVSAILGVPVFAYSTFMTQASFQDAKKDDSTHRQEMIQRLDRLEDKVDSLIKFNKQGD